MSPLCVFGEFTAPLPLKTTPASRQWVRQNGGGNHLNATSVWRETWPVRLLARLQILASLKFGLERARETLREIVTSEQTRSSEREMRNPRFSSAARRGGAASRPFPRGILARPRDTSSAPDNGRLALMGDSGCCARQEHVHRCPKSPKGDGESAARPADAPADHPKA